MSKLTALRLSPPGMSRHDFATRIEHGRLLKKTSNHAPREGNNKIKFDRPRARQRDRMARLARRKARR